MVAYPVPACRAAAKLSGVGTLSPAAATGRQASGVAGADDTRTGACRPHLSVQPCLKQNHRPPGFYPPRPPTPAQPSPTSRSPISSGLPSWMAAIASLSRILARPTPPCKARTCGPASERHQDIGEQSKGLMEQHIDQLSAPACVNCSLGAVYAACGPRFVWHRGTDDSGGRGQLGCLLTPAREEPSITLPMGRSDSSASKTSKTWLLRGSKGTAVRGRAGVQHTQLLQTACSTGRPL